MMDLYRSEALPMTAEAKKLRVATLVGEMLRAVDLLDASIKNEEDKALIKDPQNCRYPTTARSLRARRDNIQSTIATIQTLGLRSIQTPSRRESAEPSIFPDRGFIRNDLFYKK
jgi:hypothetical protein